MENWSLKLFSGHKAERRRNSEGKIQVDVQEKIFKFHYTLSTTIYTLVYHLTGQIIYYSIFNVLNMGNWQQENDNYEGN